MRNSRAAAALQYVKTLPVFPIHSSRDGNCTCGRTACKHRGKHPRVKGGFLSASMDAAIIEQWWAKWPDANIGVPTGETTGIVVIDVDPRHGGDQSLAALFAEHGEFPETIEVATGGGGRHFYFRHPGIEIRNKVSVRPGIDVRGDGGYIIAPPSIHASGRPYEFIVGRGPRDMKPAPLPAWLMAMLLEMPAKSTPAASRARDRLIAAASRYVDKVEGTTEGGRNAAGFSLAGHLHAFELKGSKERLSESDIAGLMSTWNTRNTPALDDDELNAVIRSAASNGTQREPHVVESEGKDTTAALLVKLAESADLFRCDEDAYASIIVAGHRETYPIRSKSFRMWLTRLFYCEFGRVPNAQALTDAIGALQGGALFDGPVRTVGVRIAAHDGAIWLDLADADWRGVRIDEHGWRVVASEAVPVRFVRRRAMRALPIPATGGSVSELRPFLNLQEEQDWILLLGWIMAAFRPSGPYPILHVCGEHGTAKSTLCRIIRSLLDPNKAPLRSGPREPRDLMIAANNAWLLMFDNLSGVPDWMSDALCRMATGGGFSTRELFSDDDEIVFDAMRPIAVNGIEGVASRPDLLDRCVTLTLEPIPENRRRTEAELWREFEAVRPRILGALLTAVSTAMRRVRDIKLPMVPRMADFAVWATAAEPGLEMADGAFMAAYERDRAAAQEAALENSSIGRTIVSLASTRMRWVGTASELLVEINADQLSTDSQRRSAEWPKTGKKLSGELRRLAPSLRASGISVVLPKRRTGRAKRREIVIEHRGDEQAARAAQAANPILGVENAVLMRPIGADDGSTHLDNGSTFRANGSTPTLDPELEMQIAAHAACAAHRSPSCSTGGSDDCRARDSDVGEEVIEL